MTRLVGGESEGAETLAPARSADPLALAEANEPRPWTRHYLLMLLAADFVAAATAVAIGWTARIGFPTTAAVNAYLLLSLIVAVAWIISVHAVGGYDVRRISVGAGEFQRILRAALNLAGCVAIAGYLSGSTIARTFVAIVIPAGALLMIVGRYLVRRRVYACRRRGRWTTAILVVGTRESAQHLVEGLSRNPAAGLVAVGACVEDAEIGCEIVPGVAVLGDVSSAAEVAAAVDADVVAVASTGLGPRRIRELGWALEGTSRHMLMAPGLTEVAGPRVHVSPVEGLPLMWVDPPQFSGMSRLAKRAVDAIGAALLLVLASPLLVAIALVIRLTSRGPALFRQKRLGKDGEWVTVLKFRTMFLDADQRRDDLLHLNESSHELFFKVRDDPRVTPFGRMLRRTSLDELPQLLNVLLGSMSLVGPRPLPGELDLYAHEFRRRMMVKPGLTGLWQVSGRSDLGSDDAVRLDLYYVENWSLSLDLAIIARTLWVVLRSRGAY
ncbi:MAG: sugar transferase [Jatrophihabitantaceae bacterium]